MKIENTIKYTSPLFKSREAKESAQAQDNFLPESPKTSIFSFVKNKQKQSKLRFAQEFNLKDIRRQSKSQNDSMLNIADGTAFLLALDKKTYEPHEDYVCKAGLRKAVTQKLEQEHPGEKITWTESVGVAEVGDGFFATIPLFRTESVAVGLGFGFSAGVIIRYRRSYPVVGDDPSNLPWRLPFKYSDAQRMQAGQEFELCGQGRLRLDESITARYGAQALVAVAGAQASLVAVENLAAEYSVSILALDGKNRIRVTVRKIDQESLGVGVTGLLGLIFPGNGIWQGNWGLPQLGHGLLKYMVEHRGNATFESYLSDYTTLSINTSWSLIHKSTHICSFDFDLTNNKAAQAYEKALKLNLQPALKLAAQNNGVTKIELLETQHAHKSMVRLALCSEKLFLTEALRSESEGNITDERGSNCVYRDRSYKKHHENWFTGQTDALWESVEISKDQQKSQSYCHFNYRKGDLFTRQAEIDKFVNFAQAMGIKYDGESHSCVVTMPWWQKLFSNADDSQITIDLYINPEGVTRIRESKTTEIISAYLSTRASLYKKIIGHPWLSENIYKTQNLRLFKLYSRARFLGQSSSYTSALEKQYLFLNNRSLKLDFLALSKALNFAKLMKKLSNSKEKDKNIAKFFTKIGEKRGLHYTSVLPTLTKLAGRDNVLVHTLSASGGGVKLSSVDEGALTHPRNAFVNSCLRA